MSAPKTIFITKHCLTAGILELELIEIKGDMAIVKNSTGLNGRGYFHGKEWHLTLAEAQRHARDTVRAKMESLRKQQVKLEALLTSGQFGSD